MINNTEQIKKLLIFESEDDFYHLQVLMRKKEHPELGRSSKLIKTYYIKSIEHLEKVIPEIILLCDFHDARAYINLNRRSFEQLGFHTLEKIIGQMQNKDFSSIKNAYDSVCGMYTSEKNRKWVVDYDGSGKLSQLINDIKNCEPNRRTDKVYAILETKNGSHLITSPFNVEEFSKLHPEIEIHKNNPTILYIK